MYFFHLGGKYAKLVMRQMINYKQINNGHLFATPIMMINYKYQLSLKCKIIDLLKFFLPMCATS